MKLRFWDRIFSALMGVILLLCAAGVMLCCLGIFPMADYLSMLAQGWLRWAAIVVCALVMLLGLHGIALLFRRRRDKGFVMQRTEYGDMSISMKALENMVKKCVEAHPELKVSHTKIYRVRNGVSVEIRILLMSGVNIPLAVNALQKQIKQYITSCSGVDVHEVRVKVETDIARLAPPAEVPLVGSADFEDTMPLPVEKICQHMEEPQTYDPKPAETPEKPAEPAEEVLAVTETENGEAPEAAEEPAEPAEEPAIETAEEEEAQA